MWLSGVGQWALSGAVNRQSSLFCCVRYVSVRASMQGITACKIFCALKSGQSCMVYWSAPPTAPALLLAPDRMPMRTCAHELGQSRFGQAAE